MKNTKLNNILTITIATVLTAAVTLWSLTFTEKFFSVLFTSLILAGLYNFIVDTLQGEKREIDYTENWSKWVASMFFNQIAHTLLLVLLLMYIITTMHGEMREYVAYVATIVILSKLLLSDFSPYIFGYYSVQRKINEIDKELDLIEFCNRPPLFSNKKDAM